MGLPAIAIHGGAGIYGDESLPEALEGVRRAAAEGWAALASGGSALAAVLAAVRTLEDDPSFNAGTGSVLTADGTVENDAAVMSGADLSAGAVGALVGFANPVLVAEEVRRATSHVLLVGEGARRFAISRGLATVDPASLITERQRARWRAEAQQRGLQAHAVHGTVGAVAADAAGHVAAATSTGGLLFKLPGRVGDTPIVGGGTYADDEAGAASCTGQGEAILKVTLAKSAIERLRGGATATAAAEAALAELSRRTSGEAGLILVDRRGGVGFAFNTGRMSRAWADAEHPEPQAAIERGST
ncbi:MAG: isoaspartyl peptidase/L-asparaginase family protein [Myxococcales bacterium]